MGEGGGEGRRDGKEGLLTVAVIVALLCPSIYLGNRSVRSLSRDTKAPGDAEWAEIDLRYSAGPKVGDLVNLTLKGRGVVAPHNNLLGGLKRIPVRPQLSAG